MSLDSTSDLENFVQPAPDDWTTTEGTYESFAFEWGAGALSENASYGPLVEYVMKSTNAKAKDISSGKGLPGGFFYDVKLHTLRSRVSVRSNKLRIDHSKPKFIFDLRGRSDVVVWDARHGIPGRTTTRYCIEVKTAEEMRRDINECLREAFLQLIGLNAYNPSESPAVVLTDLTKLHYVLFLTKESNMGGYPLKYNLNIYLFSEFARALWFAEMHLGSRIPCCMHLFTFLQATPESTSRLQREDSTDSDDDNCCFDSVWMSDTFDGK